MTVQNYEALLRDVAGKLNIDAEGLAARQVLLSGTTQVRFLYLARLGLCRLTIALAPSPDPSAAYRWMLEANYDRAGIDLLPVLALDPATGRPFVFFHVGVTQPNAAAAIANLVVTGLPTFLLGWNDACTAESISERVRAQRHLDTLA